MDPVDDPSTGNLLDDVWIVDAFSAFFSSFGMKAFPKKQRPIKVFKGDDA
jgi:hypothetical protein